MPAVVHHAPTWSGHDRAQAQAAASAEDEPSILRQNLEAEARATSDQIEVTMRQQPITGLTCPESLVRYVIRTRESVILDDASKPTCSPRTIICAVGNRSRSSASRSSNKENWPGSFFSKTC
jgi:hypothetical protein